MSGGALLAEGLVKANSAGYGNVQGFDYAYLWDNKITVGQRSDLFTYT